MRKVNVYHQQVLDNISIYNLNFDGLRKKYGLPFLYPKKNFDIQSDYAQELRDAGIELDRWFEDFIDESNGNVVSLPRYQFKALEIVKNSYRGLKPGESGIIFGTGFVRRIV